MIVPQLEPDVHRIQLARAFGQAEMAVHWLAARLSQPLSDIVLLFDRQFQRPALQLQRQQQQLVGAKFTLIKTVKHLQLGRALSVWQHVPMLAKLAITLSSWMHRITIANAARPDTHWTQLRISTSFRLLAPHSTTFLITTTKIAKHQQAGRMLLACSNAWLLARVLGIPSSWMHRTTIASVALPITGRILPPTSMSTELSQLVHVLLTHVRMDLY
jgi:hypothetical protein